MGDNHPSRHSLVRLFRVVDDSMLPGLRPGDGLIGMRVRSLKRGQLRVFPDPRLSTRWLVKRVGDVYVGTSSTSFEARSDNPRARGAVDSHEFGPIPAAGSYRVVWSVRPRRRSET